ncbi:hypothetical protein CYMTET_37135 [Cymbomonas tetramitiformis]|uniref:EF-hand domain-containing protein n=1 Tax=Cymbomonas tetramitiformis TaxID=36881 RepID=A0AAE0CEK2_9CHLO|nr:hypothetical protein CYMTET_37135 [Cymbomonas tetramitiformis]
MPESKLPPKYNYYCPNFPPAKENWPEDLSLLQKQTAAAKKKQRTVDLKIKNLKAAIRCLELSDVRAQCESALEKVEGTVKSKQFMKDLYGTFKDYDKDDNGLLTIDELLPLALQFGQSIDFWPKESEHMIALFLDFDDDKDHRIDVSEFLHFVTFVAVAVTEGHIQQILQSKATVVQLKMLGLVSKVQTYDMNVQELCAPIIAEVQGTISSPELVTSVAGLFKSFDFDDNQLLTRDELVEVATKMSSFGDSWPTDRGEILAILLAFDMDQDQKLDHAEFLEFVKFVLLTMAETRCENVMYSKATLVQLKLLALIEKVESYPSEVLEMCKQVVLGVQEYIASSGFDEQVQETFEESDTNANKFLTQEELIPLAMRFGLLASDIYLEVDEVACLEFFSNFDVNNDGRLDCGEFKDFCKYITLNMAEQQCEEIFINKASLNQLKLRQLSLKVKEFPKEARVMCEEVLKGLQQMFTMAAFEDQIASTFKYFDEDGSNFLDKEELLPIALQFGVVEEGWPVDEEALAGFFFTFDVNNDGKLDRDEFREFMKYIYINVAETQCDAIMESKLSLVTLKMRSIVYKIMQFPPEVQSLCQGVFEDVQFYINSAEFDDQVNASFKDFDKDANQHLTLEELVPMAIEFGLLAEDKIKTMGALDEEAVIDFFSAFDVNGDGRLDLGEYKAFTQFITLNITEKQCDAIFEAKASLVHLKHRALMNQVKSYPPEIAEMCQEVVMKTEDMITSSSFVDSVIDTFDRNDEDKNEVLSQEELIPMAMKFSTLVENWPTNEEDVVKMFMSFDVNNDGALEWTEFLEFAKYVALHIAEETCEGIFRSKGTIVQHKLRHLAEKVNGYSDTIRDSCMQTLMKTEVMISSPEFAQSVEETFTKHDVSETQVLLKEELLSLALNFSDLVDNWPTDEAAILSLFMSFDVNGDEKLDRNEFFEFAKYITLHMCEQTIEGMFLSKASLVELKIRQIMDLIASLPPTLVDDSMKVVQRTHEVVRSEEFAMSVDDTFKSHDADANAFLTRDELVPLALQFSKLVDNWPTDEIAVGEIFMAFDVNNDAKLDKNEFTAFVEYISYCMASDLIVQNAAIHEPIPAGAPAEETSTSAPAAEAAPAPSEAAAEAAPAPAGDAAEAAPTATAAEAAPSPPEPAVDAAPAAEAGPAAKAALAAAPSSSAQPVSESMESEDIPEEIIVKK